MAADLVSFHIQQAVQVGVMENVGRHYDASKLRAQAHLRMVVMSPDEIAELAHLLNLGLDDITDVVSSLRDTADLWITDLLMPWEDYHNTN